MPSTFRAQIGERRVDQSRNSGYELAPSDVDPLTAKRPAGDNLTHELHRIIWESSPTSVSSAELLVPMASVPCRFRAASVPIRPHAVPRRTICASRSLRSPPLPNNGGNYAWRTRLTVDHVDVDKDFNILVLPIRRQRLRKVL